MSIRRLIMNPQILFQWCKTSYSELWSQLLRSQGPTSSNPLAFLKKMRASSIQNKKANPRDLALLSLSIRKGIQFKRADVEALCPPFRKEISPRKWSWWIATWMRWAKRRLRRERRVCSLETWAVSSGMSISLSVGTCIRDSDHGE